MQPNPSNSPHFAVFKLVIVLAVVVPMLYVLSFGPVAGLAQRGYLPAKPVLSFYYPIKLLHEKAGPPISTMLERYLDCFD
jgi:hypothetical protein